MGWLRLLCGLGIVASGAGCGLKVRAQAADGLVLIRDGRGVVAAKEGISVFVEYARVPWAEKDDAAGFFVEVTNQGTYPIQLRLEDFVFIDGAGRRRLPESPTQMIEAFRSAQGRAEDFVVQVGLRYGSRHGWGYPYRYYYGYPYYYDYDWEYYERRRWAKFLSSLLWSRDLKVDEVVGGYVVFGGRIEEDEAFGLEITLQKILGAVERAAEGGVGAGAAPADSQPASVLESPSAVQVTPVRFYFPFLVE